MTAVKITDEVARIEREHTIAIEALRRIRDHSTGHDDAISMAITALRHVGVVPQPTFQSLVDDWLVKHTASMSLGDGLQRLAASEAATERALVEGCASCERQERIDGPAGLCDGCLDALGDAA